MEVGGSVKREKSTTTMTNDNNRRIIEINATDEPTYEDIERMEKDDKDEEEEEQYPTGDGINDDDWARLFEISDYAYATATTSPQDQVETNTKENNIKRRENQKKQNELIFKKYCIEQVELTPKEGWPSTEDLPWRKDYYLVTKVDKDLKYREVRRRHGGVNSGVHMELCKG